jgi:DNA (cytosine-5)-methyltransferase 1
VDAEVTEIWVVDRRTNSKGPGWRDGGGMVPTVPVSMDRPAPTLTAKAGQQWVFTRPATTVCADPRLGSPGHRDREGGEPQFGSDAIKLTVPEALTLQSFRPDYPVQGNKGKQYEQIGNAVPPLLAAHVIGALVGRKVA